MGGIQEGRRGGRPAAARCGGLPFLVASQPVTLTNCPSCARSSAHSKSENVGASSRRRPWGGAGAGSSAMNSAQENSDRCRSGVSSSASQLAACRSFLEGQGRPDLAREARRVSLISEAMGWDISVPNLAGQVCRLEVKCYRGRDPTVYLTRHEFNVGLRRSKWYLVLCRSAGDSEPEVVGWTTLAPLIPRMPIDVGRSAEWQVSRVRIGESEVRPGLPLLNSGPRKWCDRRWT